MDKVARFEALGGGIEPGSGNRPTTPPNQNAQSRYPPPALCASPHLRDRRLMRFSSDYFPPTPMETPHDRLVKHEPQRPRRFAEDYDEVDGGDDQADPRQQVEQPELGHLPGDAPACRGRGAHAARGAMGFISVHGISAADFMSMNSVNAEFGKIEANFDGLPVVGMTANHPHHAPAPMTPQMGYDAFENRPDFRPPEYDSQNTVMQHPLYSPAAHDGSVSPSRRASPHRRTESLASMASAASIASLNIEETKTETGVTLDDISAYIDGPDAKDGKWVCTFDGCNKQFGRKENIKSHVQTHLNDRQYQCPTCKKCFVRQHDLKRHAKIHTGIKPYPCECGNSFARHDALTRHRQRGMCIGAFDGIVRKVVKRGRPKKHRPDMEERREKSERTRRKNKTASSCSSAYSQSGYSDSSAVNSPANDFDLLDDKPFSDMMDVAMDDSDPMGIPRLGRSGRRQHGSCPRQPCPPLGPRRRGRDGRVAGANQLPVGHEHV